MSVPRRIFQAWIGPDPIPEREKAWCEQMRKMNLDFEYHFFRNELLDQYGTDAYVRYMMTRGEKLAFVMDRIRLLLLRDYEGGIWIDPDSQPVKPLNRLKWWDAPHVDFVTAHRDPYRTGVSLYRGIALVDNTVMASAPHGRILNRLMNLYESRTPVRRGGEFGREIMRHSGMDVVWEDSDVFYALTERPESVLLHDAHNLASWTSEKPMQFANV